MSALAPNLSAQLQEIASDFYADKFTREQARAAVLDLTLAQINCSRVSFWRFNEQEGELSLLCFASKVAGGQLDNTQSCLLQSEYENYFDELVKAGVYVSEDAHADANLQPMRDRYLLPFNVCALMDCAFAFNGRAYGMVCCEQTGAPRQWSVDEVTTLRVIVAKLALLMASASDPVLWATPSLSMEPIAQGNSRPGRLDMRF
jgi:GAF domain-containing protein